MGQQTIRFGLRVFLSAASPYPWLLAIPSSTERKMPIKAPLGRPFARSSTVVNTANLQIPEAPRQTLDVKYRFSHLRPG